MHLKLVCLALACGCVARGSPAVIGDPRTQPMPGHDMTAMDHDASAMSRSHSLAEIAFLFPDGNDKGWSKLENGVQHNMAPELPPALLPPATRAELQRQLALTMDVIKKYPTVRDAEAAGYRRAGPFIPGLGTHYVGGRNSRTGVLSDDDITHPSTIIYHGNKPDSPIAGFMYMAAAPNGVEPEGFAGPNDHWHFHSGICLVAGPTGSQEALGFDGSITQQQCGERKGRWLANSGYLLHVWTVPSYTDPLGVFAHMNPLLTCGDGTYYTDDRDITNQCRVS